ncbi:1-deoxy-D-xylulose-5-phosphate synthase [Bienertia sinuspersici]
MACVPCAIEMEPKTLSPGQINHVREQAEAIQKLEPQKSADIFVQGLLPINEGDHNIIGIGDNMIDECNSKDEKIEMEKAHKCLCTSILIKSPEEVSQGEPLTAPF